MSPRLKEVIFSITNRCNLRCAMCQIPEKEDREELDTQGCRDLIRDAARLCPESIVFSGGEPLLRQDIFELLTYVGSFKINTCLTSNGTLIDEGMAQRLAAAGVGVINVSLEGPKEVHDRLRGLGSFEKACRAIEILRAHKIETTIATIVCRQNYATLSDVMDLARRYNVSTVKFQPFSDIFLKDKTKHDDFFIPSSLLPDVQASLDRVIELAKSCHIEINPKEYLADMASYLCGLDSLPLQHSCRALWTSCPISAQGDVYLCWVLAQKPIGNVRHRALSGIWNSQEHDRLRKDVLEKGCRGCLMSCYDRNFVPGGLRLLSRLKPGALKKLKKKRFYFRVYQVGRYMAGKVVRASLDRIRILKKDGVARDKVISEIEAAKQKINKEIEALKDV